MTALERGILNLLRSGITGEPLALGDGFDLEAAQPLLQKHSVLALAYIGAVNCGIDKNLPVMQQMFRTYCLIMMKSQRQMKAVEQLCSAFEAAGIDYMPLKGCNMKRLYPKPETRQMGDADILIHSEDYEKIRPIVAGLGFTGETADISVMVWNSNDLYLELHMRLISTDFEDYCARYGDGWQRAQNVHGYRFGLKPEDEYVFLFVHFAKHYRVSGIGCRHVMDLWVYRRAHPEMDFGYIREELEKMRLWEFHEYIRKLTEVWFEGAEADERTEFIHRFILDSGNWGQWKNYVLSQAAKNTKYTGSVQAGNLRGVLRMVFPDVEHMLGRYPFLMRAPYLLPVCWALRGASVLLFRRHKVRALHKSVVIASPDQIENYQQALEYVGLDFDIEHNDNAVG